MTEEVTVELDDVQEFILQKVTDDETDQGDVVQAVFDDALWQLYQRWKQAEGDAPVAPEE